MTIAITDANIFIDLFELDLITLFFKLELDIYTTQEVLLECDKEQRAQLQKFIKKKKLHLQMISDEEVLEMESMGFNRGLSGPDKSVLFVAKRENGMVISGDKLIRKWCKKNQIEVHGMLWVVEAMKDAELLSNKEAIESLELLLEINLWLPVNSVEGLLKQWKEE